MKRIFLVCGLFFAALTVQAEDFRYLTYVGSSLEQSFALNTLKAVTFTDTDVIFRHTDGSQVSLPLSDLSQLDFTHNATGIVAIDDNIDDESTVTIYSSNGKVVAHVNVSFDVNTVNFDPAIINALSSCPRGVYVLKQGNKTIKLMR